jgi:2-C-methyl-D-erythritol 4-phosphate cytidylyltransferase
MSKKILIVLASGVGTRFGGNIPKQFLMLGNRMVIEHTLSACDIGLFDEIILVVSSPYICEMNELVRRNGYKTPVRVVKGGATRKESCRHGVDAIDANDAIVVIHNGVQPFVSRDCFKRGIDAVDGGCDAVTSAVPCVYTVLRVDENNDVSDMPDRAQLRSDMGVECFRLSLLRRLFSEYDDDVSTDIIGMVFRSHIGKVHVIDGDPRNIKITRREDMLLAEEFIKEISHG